MALLASSSESSRGLGSAPDSNAESWLASDCALIDLVPDWPTLSGGSAMGGVSVMEAETAWLADVPDTETAAESDAQGELRTEGILEALPQLLA